MLKLFFVLLLVLYFSALHGKGVEIKILLLNNTWLKADLLRADKEGNLTIKLKKEERILRRKEFRMVKMSLPLEVRKAKELFKQNKMQEAGSLLDSAAVKYNFPVIQLKIKVLQAQVKTAESDSKGTVFILEPLLKNEMLMPRLEALSYAHGFLLLGNAYEKLDQQNNAVKAYRRSFELAVPEYSALANLSIGKMFLKQKNNQGALDCFLENISVFSPEVPGRKLSLEKTIAIYKRNKNKKLKQYEDMLKKEYSLKSNN
jgi:tetratricopeptide (TPR) repeat protein